MTTIDEVYHGTTETSPSLTVRREDSGCSRSLDGCFGRCFIRSLGRASSGDGGTNGKQMEPGTRRSLERSTVAQPKRRRWQLDRCCCCQRSYRSRFRDRHGRDTCGGDSDGRRTEGRPTGRSIGRRSRGRDCARFDRMSHEILVGDSASAGRGGRRHPAGLEGAKNRSRKGWRFTRWSMGGRPLRTRSMRKLRFRT